MRYIRDIGEGSRIQDIYYCKSKLVTETRNGKPYESLVIQDKTGTMDAKVWEPYSPAIGEYEAGDYIEITGDVIVFNGSRQAKISRLRKAQDIDYNPADYMPMTSKNIDEMYEELLKLADSVEDKDLHAMLDAFFKDEEFAKVFKWSSAAKTVHHGFIGGLLEHSLAVGKLCDHLSGSYPVLNRDLLVSAALLHDIGKTRELSPYPDNDYTDEGQLMGHIVIGAMMVSEKAKEIDGFSQKTLTDLQHCILAHHGELEFGSPKKPALIEALALSFADNLDAKLETFKEQMDNSDKDGWLGFCKFLDSNIRRT